MDEPTYTFTREQFRAIIESACSLYRDDRVNMRYDHDFAATATANYLLEDLDGEQRAAKANPIDEPMQVLTPA